MRSAIFQLLAAIWGITLFFGGASWVLAAVVVVVAALNSGLAPALEFLFEPLILLVIVGVPFLLLFLQWLMRLVTKSNGNEVEKLINQLIESHPNLGMEKRGPLIASYQQPTGMAFYAYNQVILASGQGGERYVERFDIEELRWREIRDNRGNYRGLEVFPPANARPQGGTLKIWSGSKIPGDVRAIYGANGIPLP